MFGGGLYYFFLVCKKNRVLNLSPQQAIFFHWGWGGGGWKEGAVTSTKNYKSKQIDYFFKKLRYHTRTPHTAKIHTLFKASGMNRHPVQDAE